MVILIILGLLLALAGIAGCIVPGIPGPLLSYPALLILSYAKDWEPFGLTLLIILAGLTILVTSMDYLLPAVGAKRYGASKFGVWGSIVGMFIGLFSFPPWGMLAGAMLGALAGELLAGKEAKKAVRAGWGAFVGNMAVFAAKLALSGFMLFLYIRAMF